MNSRTFAWTLVLTLLLSGCASALTNPRPATVTPDVMPRLDPSPTPSNSTLPLTCQVTDLNVYINEADGYCFAYPTRFTLGDNPSDKPVVLGPVVDNSMEPVQATFYVEVAPAAAGTSLQEQALIYLKEFSVVDPAVYTWTQLQVGGEPALLVEPVPVWMTYKVIFVQHNGYIFRLSYWPIDLPQAKADLDELTQTTLGSFAFTR